MAHMETRWDKSDGKMHVEKQISPVKAKQGRTGTRILTILVVALVLAFIGRSWSRDRVSAALFVPYAAWVLFASLLNLAIATLN